MLFNSAQFLIFFPIVCILYYLIPHKFRYLWILVSSYYFYMCWNPIYALLLLGITALTYIGALLLDGKVRKKEKTVSTPAGRTILCTVLIIGFFILGIYKYTGFILQNVQGILSRLGADVQLPIYSIVLPVGISFYLFQAIGYLIDVYRGTTSAEKNFFLYAAYISFFPQLVAGPIERADRLLPQFYEKHSFEYKKVKNSLLLMLWGFFMKVVVADRIALFVNSVYNDYMQFGGWLLLIATVLFAFQIYCDFAGYSTIAVGAAGVMGFDLMENFFAPYCAVGIRDFWSRWHISLTGWFRDYVYIPLGGNRKGKIRKSINTMIVFALSGLWHGANWSFVFWGLLNGFYIVLEDVTQGLRDKCNKLLHIDINTLGHRIFNAVITFVLVDFSWLFFRANGMRDAILIIKQIFTVKNINVLFDDTIHFYIMEKHSFAMMIISILILIAVDICHNHKIHFREILARQNIVCRWICYMALILAILIFGVWGPSFDETAFIYFQF